MRAAAGISKHATSGVTSGRLLILLLMALTLGCSSRGAGRTTDAIVIIDLSQRFQTIIGWETESYMNEANKPLPSELERKMLKSAVENAGITRLRLEIRSGAESRSRGYADHVKSGMNDAWRNRRYLVVNDNADPRLIDWSGFDFSEIDHSVEHALLPLRKELAARGEKLFINLCYVSFVKGERNAHDDPEEYAEFALATVLHLRQKYGLEPNTLEVILEPDLAGRWSGYRLGETIVATARRFAENGIHTGFVAPSTTNMAVASQYFDDMRRMTAALPYLRELSYHRYKGVSQGALADLTERSTRYHVPISMLELWFGDAGPDVLFEDLEAGVAAFQGRVLADLFVNAREGDLTLNKDVRYNAALYRTIRPGAVRIGASSSVESLKALAFRRPQGGIVAALRTKGPTNVTVRGLPIGNYVITKVTENSEADGVPARQSVNGDLQLAVQVPAVVVIAPR